MLEINTDDSLGLLYRISRTISRAGCDVDLVLISTEGTPGDRRLPHHAGRGQAGGGGAADAQRRSSADAAGRRRRLTPSDNYVTINNTGDNNVYSLAGRATPVRQPAGRRAGAGGRSMGRVAEYRQNSRHNIMYATNMSATGAYPPSIVGAKFLLFH